MSDEVRDIEDIDWWNAKFDSNPFVTTFDKELRLDNDGWTVPTVQSAFDIASLSHLISISTYEIRDGELERHGYGYNDRLPKSKARSEKDLSDFFFNAIDCFVSGFKHEKLTHDS